MTSNSTYVTSMPFVITDHDSRRSTAKSNSQWNRTFHSYYITATQLGGVMPGFHHSVAVLPLSFAVPVNHCRFRTRLPYAWARPRQWLDGQLRNGRTENRTRFYFNGRTVTAAFCRLRNGTEFSYGNFFTENGIFQRQNGETAMEKWQRNSGNGALWLGQ